ncbi:hypothetical protein M8C21_017975 [Ambrosia artemisiifolia]|uniref:non-specific serine/threonine protein kinase n=1 Tax=Ambrosia artemisiifolia TaxID=4212 RepID=A0AAD5G732_AMBAR|nr:hypothetical protein M8C21_017975 [Ambrosia artemisiifolia]
MISKSNGDARSEIVNMHCDDQLEADPSIFVQNFIRLMEITGTQIRSSHNSTTTEGIEPNKINGLAQCYGDLSTQDCILCYAQIRTAFPNCFPRSGGRIYLDGCFMRIQNYSFYDQYTSPNDTTICGNATRKSNLFQQSTRRAVANAVTGALRNSDYFAREQMLVSGGNNSVYVLAQCWKTLSPSSCMACLENASISISTCLPWSEGRVLNTGCFMRYSDTNFLNPLPVSNSLSSSNKGSYDAEKMAKILNDSSLNFKYSTVEKATEYWNESNKLGQGGFGTVYKGVLQDGREIAVKRLYVNNKFRAVDFYNEVNIISSVEHKNLVRLLGCSCSGPESILVYEYLPNMSLDRFIFDELKGREIGWEKRFQIIIGIAEGLVYLHENTKNRIIHRDIKASNILLDLRLRPKIADFGLARSFQDDKSHISTAIAGTL